MAITISLVYARPDRLRYLLAQDAQAGATVTLANDGGVTPDLQTDILSAAGAGVSGLPLLRLINARRDGFGTNPAGTVLTQAEARALFLSNTAGVALVGNDNILRARSRVTPRTVGALVAPPSIIEWVVDANIDGQGDPVLVIDAPTGVAATAYLDLHLRHTYDL